MNRTMKLPVMKRAAERLGDIKDEIKEQYEELHEEQERERRIRRRRRIREFYGGDVPATSKERELYIGLYITRKVFRGIGTMVFTLLMMLILTGTIVGTVTAFYLLDVMEKTETVILGSFKRASASYVYEMNPETNEYEMIYKLSSDEHIVKIPCDFKSIPDHVKFAFICTEDKRFYSHVGVDYKRTAGAVLNTGLRALGIKQDKYGGSTITQQLIKNVTGDNKDSPERKMREIFRAMKVERKYTKDDILEAYLNEIYFSTVDGYQLYGIEAASVGYFGKTAAELSTAEAAVLAAMIKSPNDYNPADHFEANKVRKETCLYLMFETGVISADQYEGAMHEEILLTSMPEFREKNRDYKKLSECEDDFENPAVLSWPLETALDEFEDYLRQKYNLDSRKEAREIFRNGGYKLYLSTDRKLQAYLDEKYEDWTYFPKETDSNGENIQSAIVVMDYEGHILGLEGKIGKKNPETNRGFNVAYTGGRQPGSTIKPVTTYGYAIENGLMTYSSFFYDRYLPAGTIPGNDEWPRNYDGAPSGGYYPAYHFLKKSINTLPAQIAYNEGNSCIRDIYEFATGKLHLDLDPESDMNYAPLCIGATESGPSIINLANAYMPYGNRGRYCKASMISKCVDGLTGEVIIDNENREYEQAVSGETAYIMNKMMENVMEPGGTGNTAKLSGTPLVGKTGTSENWRDISFVGLTPDYISAVWIGYDTGTNAQAIENANSASVWKNVFGNYADEHSSGKDFPECETVIHGNYCAVTGMRAGNGCPVGGTGYFKHDDQLCTVH